MRYLKDISLVIAGSILLLHTFIPHQHDSELSDAEHIEQHQEADDIFDFLQLVFHLDAGEDHLEKFKASSFLFIQPDFFESGKLLQPPYQVVKSEFIPSSNHSFSSKGEICTQKFRGPPTTS